MRVQVPPPAPFDTYMKLTPDIPRDRDGQYCLDCHAASIERVEVDGRVRYRCGACGKTLDRSLVIDNSVHWWTDDDGTYWHESAGVILIAEGKVLVGMRRIYPFGISVSAAGHVDAGERPEAAAIRELREETGIRVERLERIIVEHGFAGDSCRRGSDHHLWHLYRARVPVRPEVVPCDEASEMTWLTPEEIVAHPSLTPAFRHFVDLLGPKLFA